MSPFHYTPQFFAAVHTERLRRVRQETRPRRIRPGADDRRWG